MKTTRYFDEQVRRKRPYLRDDWIEATLSDPIRSDAQVDGRLRFWRRIELDDDSAYVLRVVTLADGETVHNAFFDRGFKEAEA